MIGAVILVAALAQNAAPPAPLPPKAVIAARAVIDAQGPRLVRDALALLDADGDACVRALQQRSFDVQGGDAPIIVARRPRDGATRTLGFWVDLAAAKPAPPASLRSAAGPVAAPADATAIDRAWRFHSASIAGRYELAALLAAIDALDAAELAAPANLVVVIDATQRLRGRGAASDAVTPPVADAWCVLAGTPYPSSRATLAFGARGRVDVDVTVLGANRPVDAGAYGNLVPNPALLIAQEIASMRDDHGNVSIQGFFEDLQDPPDLAWIMHAREAADPFEDALQSWLGIAEVEVQGLAIGSLAMRPALDVIAIDAGDHAASADQIPARASAHLRLFTVDGQSRTAAVERIRKHLGERGWTLLDREPNERERAEHWHIAQVATRDAGFDARRTHLDHRIVQPLFDAMFTVAGKPPIVQPALGEALDLAYLPVTEGGARVLLPHGFVAQPGLRDDASVGEWFHCVETMAAVLEIAARD